MKDLLRKFEDKKPEVVFIGLILKLMQKGGR